MKRKHSRMVVVFLIILLLTGSVIVLAADDNPAVNTGEIHENDFIVEGYSVTNDGTIKGDLLSVSQRLTVRGSVEGDIIAFAPDIYIGGEVGGSIRLAGTNISVSSRISRNAMLMGSSCILDNTSSVIRNAYLFGNTVKSLGTVEGDTHIYGTDITLAGVYNGDVNIRDLAEQGSFNILPGTVINGKLTYKGKSEFHLPSYAQVQDYEFIKTSPAPEQGRRFDVMSIIKRIITLVVYYLFALLLFKLFPRFFVQSGKFISQKPVAAAGIGIATLGTFVGGLLLLLIIVLLVMTILDLSILGFTSLVFIFFGLVTVVFADIPVSLWLGDMIAGRTDSIPAKLASGLIVINAAKLVFSLLGGIPGVNALGFLLNAAIWLLGTGAILKTLFSMLKAANQQAEAEDLGITEE